VESILERAEAGCSLSQTEVIRLLSVVGREESNALFAAARRVRGRHSGDRVFLYGFVYLSTYCRNDCHFCFYRASNTTPRRYRKNREQIVGAAKMLAESGVHLIDLTMGEDPEYFHDRGFEDLAAVVASVAEITHLPVMVSPGVVNERVLTMFKNAGAVWYACYQETHDRSLFERIRPGQDFDRRLNVKKVARGIGLLTEDGMLSGVGESPAGVADSLAGMRALNTDQVRVMSFVPQEGTPLSDHPPADPGAELKIIAIMRLLFPDRLIPASLDIGGLCGLQDRLNAGANVITSLVPPGEGLSGVAQSSLDIEDARRTVSSVEPVIKACGLTQATPEEYRSWIESREDLLCTNSVATTTEEASEGC
jgi:methylornithine synthase